MLATPGETFPLASPEPPDRGVAIILIPLPPFITDRLLFFKVFREWNSKATANLWTNSLWCLPGRPAAHGGANQPPSARRKPSSSRGTSLSPTRESAINLLRNSREVTGNNFYGAWNTVSVTCTCSFLLDLLVINEGTIEYFYLFFFPPFFPVNCRV